MTNPQRSILWLSGGGSIALVAFLLFVLLPLQNGLQEKSDALYQSRVDEQAAREQKQNLSVAKVEYERLKSTTDQFAKFYASETSILQIIASLDGVALQNGVQASVENLQAPLNNEKSSSFAVTATGTFTNLMRYLNSVEQLDTYMTFTDVDFRVSPSGAGPEMLLLKGTLPWQ